MITNNHYPQLRDYISQIIGLSNKNGLPIITQTLVAEKLNLKKNSGSSTVCRFLKHETQHPRLMLTHFIEKYPKEFHSWPDGEPTIGKILQVKDALYFLGIPRPQDSVPQPAPSPLAISGSKTPDLPLKSPEIKKVFDVVESYTAPLPSLPNEIQPAPRSHNTQSPIAISYRGHLTIKDGSAMLFDHMRFQDITDCPTAVIVPADRNILKETKKIFNATIKEHPAALPFGQLNEHLTKSPPFVQECSELGLLIIPGKARVLEHENVRMEHEYSVIRGALNRGQPILGICAGSWSIFEQLYTWTHAPDKLTLNPAELSNWHKNNSTLIDVKDHNYGGGMLRLNALGRDAVYNVQIHDVRIEPSTQLHTAMKHPNGPLEVNSVHWKAVNQDKLPRNVQICAFAQKNPHIEKKTRQGTPMDPQTGSVEAYENVLGAPVMAVQWHPEGYNSDSVHGNLIKYMTAAGNAYAAKRKVLTELKESVGRAPKGPK